MISIITLKNTKRLKILPKINMDKGSLIIENNTEKKEKLQNTADCYHLLQL